MTPVDHAHRLRRTVAQLARCRIEDIESVWAMLSAAERERLRPLLAEASHAVTGHATPFAIAPDDDEIRIHVDRLVHALTALPIELAARLAAGLGDAERDSVFVQLTDARRQALAGHIAKHTEYRLSQRAADALRDAALAVAATRQVAPSAPALEPQPLRVRLRNWLRTRR
ncbi:hypothetical protein U0E23_19040 [Burkholderia stagnalis]|uniref:hypothetical protein n=1 Tax=Burkholderia stagnalis TaxID=1503054 RepID=UPI002AB446F7|nr:hypothetical protein [Burkholderia stagnalis]MDY7804542.1 hypothetical protein [Burkholderia stagnalis]